MNPISAISKRLFGSRARRVAGLAVLMLAALAAYFGLAPSEPPAPEQARAQVARGDIENLVTATGTLQPRDYVDVGAQVSGLLKSLRVEVGSEVKKGELLAEIDATLYAASVDASRAQLRNQQAQMREREASLKLAIIAQQRQQNLYAAEATTRESLENAEASLVAAKAQLESLAAQIEQTESSLRADEAKLQYASIYAPMDGTVVSISTKQGQTLNANQTAPILLRIADLSTVTVKAQVSEADVGKIKSGMAVYFTTLGSEGRRWHSHLERIEPTPQNLNNVILYNALFDVPNQGRELMSEMTAQVFFVAGAASDVIMVPVSALTIMPPREKRGRPPVASGAAAATSDARAAPQAPAANAARAEDNSPREPRQARSGTPAQALAPGERRARAQVLNADGSISERMLVIGVTNRVNAEVKSGLEVGETVLLSVKRETPPRPSGQGGSPRGPMGPAGMMR